ncbi:aldehyde dehydrogenase family protein [Lysinibacillus boronitolerans]|uniref:Aldehyde dehydrogenase n=1 Tax=Lysinibacillus boronitolerans JCM 21713 = 10a = NBRC 103108 TaxID=1294264 RepID=A0ABR4Y192_9BACI|nr:aldehyde dehydrogenase family protein [Lysinibacillus boronitolerans]KGR87087.1 aldehyde dehydrogenase [Lysinibacillus boronitolerans JCM 21713 = 10a = NBRC 103108]
MQKHIYVNGQWEATASYTTLNAPYSKKEIAEIPQATEEDVLRAIDAAYDTKKTVANMTAFERSQVLEQLITLLLQHKEKAAKIISLEAGKPIKYALLEVERTIETYKFAAEEAKRLVGEMIPMDAAENGKNRFGYTLEQSIGVVAAITPFNFPQNLIAHKVGPAIAAGNTIILKPASQTPLSALFLAELMDQTSLPKGAFNVITGSGKLVGDVLIQSDKVNMITFTGSPAVGIDIRNRAGLKKVALELGSNAGLIIDKKVNLDDIVAKCVVGAFSNQGQVCISLQRVYVMDSLYDEFLAKFIAQTETLVLGDPLEMTTDISSLIHANEEIRALDWINEALANGANLATGGKLHNHMLMPTILTNVADHLKVSCQEVFAPIVIVNRITSIQEGIEAINNSKYGLQAGIFTNDIQTAFMASKALEVGGVMINDIPTYRVDQMPYGGVKESGTGKEGVKYAIQEMTEKKLIVWNQS